MIFQNKIFCNVSKEKFQEHSMRPSEANNPIEEQITKCGLTIVGKCKNKICPKYLKRINILQSSNTFNFNTDSVNAQYVFY